MTTRLTGSPWRFPREFVVVAGAGIEGDRYFGRHEEPGQNITLVEAEEIDRLMPMLSGSKK